MEAGVEILSLLLLEMDHLVQFVSHQWKRWCVSHTLFLSVFPLSHSLCQFTVLWTFSGQLPGEIQIVPAGATVRGEELFPCYICVCVCVCADLVGFPDPTWSIRKGG